MGRKTTYFFTHKTASKSPHNLRTHAYVAVSVLMAVTVTIIELVCDKQIKHFPDLITVSLVNFKSNRCNIFFLMSVHSVIMLLQDKDTEDADDAESRAEKKKHKKEKEKDDDQVQTVTG